MSDLDPAKWTARLGEALLPLLNSASKDSDPVSVFVIGDNWEQCEGALLLVKGGASAFTLLNILKSKGMVTEGKGVEDGSKPSLHSIDSPYELIKWIAVEEELPDDSETFYIDPKAESLDRVAKEVAA